MPYHIPVPPGVGSGDLLSSNNLSDVANAGTARTNLGINGDFLAKASSAGRPGLISSGAAAIGVTQDNTGLAFGTGDLTIGVWAQAANWTPSSIQYLGAKYASSIGVEFFLNTNGTIRVTISGTTYTSTAVTGLTDGTWAFISATLDRDGNAVFYVNGSQLGNAVSIAAQSAVSMTGSGALRWGSSGTGDTGRWVGTFGESWIVAGLLTSTQVANIYRAGSIAPLCAFAAASATTGQSVATIGGLSFYQWVDFGQGYGPIIRDRSGNNQHALMGTTGLTHAVPRNPPGVPRRAPKVALVFDGSAGGRVFATLGAQEPAAGDFTVWIDARIPESFSTESGMLMLSDSATTAGSENAFVLLFPTSSSSLRARARGATGSDYRELLFSAFATLFAGKRVVLAFTRVGTTVRLFVGCDGDFLDVTALVTEATAGTPPAWDFTVGGDYLGVGYTTASNSSRFTYFDARLANVAMSEAELRAAYVLGEPGPQWRGATKTSKNTFTNAWKHGAGEADSADTVGGGASAMTVASTAGQRTGGAGSYFVRGTSASSDALNLWTGNLPTGFDVVPGQKIRVRAWLKSSANRTINELGLRTLNAGSAVASTASAGWAVTDTWTQFSAVLTASAAGTIRTLLFAKAATGTSETLDVDDIEIEVLGYTARLRTDKCLPGSQVLNGTRSTTNDSTDFLCSATGVTVSPEPTTGTIRVSGTATGYLLADQRIIPSGWFIESVRVDANGTLSLGSSAAAPTDVLELAGTELVGDTPSTGKLYLTLGTATTFALTIMIRRNQ